MSFVGQLLVVWACLLAVFVAGWSVHSRELREREAKARRMFAGRTEPCEGDR